MIAYVPWALGAFGAALVWRKISVPTPALYPWPRPKNVGAPFAMGDPRPIWPIHSDSDHSKEYEVAYRDVNGKIHGNASRRFLADRPNGRFHVGIDLYADASDVVLAPESGKIINAQDFLESIPGQDAILIQGYNGVTVLLGELMGASWKQFGLEEGSIVQKGQPVGRVGMTAGGSHMLHIETYSCCPTTNSPWYKGKPRPKHVLDPSDYLLRAKAVST